jgi:hypothetical protein
MAMLRATSGGGDSDDATVRRRVQDRPNGSAMAPPSPFSAESDVRRGERGSTAAGPLEAVELSLLRYLGQLGNKENGKKPWQLIYLIEALSSKVVVILLALGHISLC